MYLFQDTTSAVFSVSGDQGLEWWLGRSAFLLVVHEEEIDHGPRVVDGYIFGH